MFRILFATDGSEAAQEGRDVLLSLPLEGAAEVRLVTVVPPADTTFQQGRRAYELADSAQRSWAEWVLEQTTGPLAERGIAVSAEPRAGETDDEIIEAARQWGADLIVIGAHGLTGLRAFILGSTARNVAHHAGCSVLVARTPHKGLENVVLGVDGSDHARKAVEVLAHLPLPPESSIAAVAAARPYQPVPSVLFMDTQALEEAALEIRERQKAECERVAAEAASHLQSAGKHSEPLGLLGDPATEILALAEARAADLVVVGARGVSRLAGLLVGSVADRVLAGAKGSVLIAR